MSNIPADLLYSKSHEWVRVDGDTVTIGITDHAQEELGDVVYASLPTVGRVLSADDRPLAPRLLPPDRGPLMGLTHQGFFPLPADVWE